MAKNKKNILERLAEGPVIGDGGFVFALEKRGYVKAGPWTPEANVENPEAVLQLHREFLRAGADVMQAFTFYASDDKLSNRGNEANTKYTGASINEAGVQLARKVADEGDALVLGGICQCPTYLSGVGKKAVQIEFKKQIDVFVKCGVDFLLCEYFEHIEEMEWAIEVCRQVKPRLPIASTMCIGPGGDLHKISTAECAVRMAQAGSDIVGINCHFDPDMCLDGMEEMKKGLDAAKLKPFLMVQPLAYMTPDCNTQGFIDLPEFPFALEPRICTRWDIQAYARRAHSLGIHYIGGCCGFEPYHVRAVAEELAKERQKLPPASEKHDVWGGGLRMHTKPWVRTRANREYWENMKPASGRPYCAALSAPDSWGCTAGDKILKQQKAGTTIEEIKDLHK